MLLVLGIFLIWNLPLIFKPMFYTLKTTDPSETDHGGAANTTAPAATENSSVCICEGRTTLPDPVNLSSPYFEDGIFLESGAAPNCCAPLPADDKIHVFASAKHLQYGHFVLNLLAPLWDKLQNVEGLDLEHPENISIHLFCPKENNDLLPGYLRQYLKLFAGTVTMQTSDWLGRQSLRAQRVVLGLSNATLDHYNTEADPRLWRDFRNFLVEHIPNLMPPTRRKRAVRVLILQRRDSRQFDDLAALQTHMEMVLQRVVGETRTAEVYVTLLEGKSVFEQARFLGNADILVAADGTGLVNGLYMPDSSCILSILPYGVPRLIPWKGTNFQGVFEKMGWKYIVRESLPVKGSLDVVKRAEAQEEWWDRWFMLDQMVRVDLKFLEEDLTECLAHLS